MTTITTTQPQWAPISSIGDVDPIAFGGAIVYEDQTGHYPPEMTWFEPAPDEDWQRDTEDGTRNAKVAVYRIVLDPPRFKALTAKGMQEGIGFGPLHADQRGDTWEWYNEWYVGKVGEVADSTGQSAFSLLRSLMSRVPVKRAMAYQDLIGYFGPDEFDSCLVEMPEAEAYQQYSEDLKKVR